MFRLVQEVVSITSTKNGARDATRSYQRVHLISLLLLDHVIMIQQRHSGENGLT